VKTALSGRNLRPGAKANVISLNVTKDSHVTVQGWGRLTACVQKPLSSVVQITGGCNPGTGENLAGCAAVIVSVVMIPSYVYIEARGSVVVEALC
jgi:hypothetical protein